MKRTTLILFVMFSLLFAKDIKEFPLWGSTWIIGEGENSWIYPSAARFRPQKVALVSFEEYGGETEIRYANLELCEPMYSTAEAINEMMKQFFNTDKNEKYDRSYLEFVNGDSSLESAAKGGLIKVPFNKINKEYSPLQIEYYPYNDTVWSLHRYAEELKSKNNRYTKYILQFGTREVECEGEFFSDTTSEKDRWTTTKPLLITYKIANPEEISKFDTSVVAVTMDCDSVGENCTDVYVPKGVDAMNIDEYASQLVKRSSQPFLEIIEYHPCDINSEKLKNSGVEFYRAAKEIGFWRLHIAPEVWFFHRDNSGEKFIYTDSTSVWRDGRVSVINDVIMFQESDTDTIGLQYASAMRKRQGMVASGGAGIEGVDKLQKITKWINPVLSSVASTIISVSFRGDVENFGDKIFLDSQDPELKDSVSNNLFFAHNPPRMYKVSSNNDMERAAIKLHAQDSLEEKEAEKLVDCSNWKYTDSITSTYIFPEDSVGNRYRNKDIDDAVYMYDGCPCDTIKGIGATPMELRRYIYKPLLTHSLDMAQEVNRVFTELWRYLYAKEDREMLNKKILQSQVIIDELEKAYKKIYGDSPYPVLEKRPKTWLDDAPIKRILRGY